jgi:HD-GYP domain-containing protein (c-di-GMP phosphodiesterase class II)
MPALKNPRHEAFAQAIFSGIVNAKGGAHSQAEAYRRAGYHVTNSNSARACSSRLLTFANGIAERVKELQAIAAEQAAETAEKCVAELNQLRKDAHVNKAYAAAVSAVMGKAKILNLITDRIEDVTNVDYNSAQSMTDIGRKLLQSIGFKEPDDVSIAAAIELNDTFIDGLQRIRNAAQGPMLEQVDD